MKQKKTSACSASVTLEAALALPFFLYFMVNLLTLFDVLRVQSALEAALHQTGREIGIYAFDVAYADNVLHQADDGGGGASSVAGAVVSTAYATVRVREYMELMCPNMHCVVNGKDGILLTGAGILTDDGVVELNAYYRVQPLVKIMGFTSFTMKAHYYGHAWTGYQIPGTDAGNQSEEMVYITETGTVYHRSSSCTYLKPSVRGVAGSSLGSLRNAGGGKYYPCEACGGGSGAVVYVTTYGDRYHASASCSKLARTIYTVPISETGGRAPCSKCGGSH